MDERTQDGYWYLITFLNIHIRSHTVSGIYLRACYPYLNSRSIYISFASDSHSRVKGSADGN